MMSQTSLMAFCKLIDTNKLNANEMIVFDVFKNEKYGRTCHEVAEMLGWSDNRVSGRITSLKMKGWLVPVARKINRSTGHTADILVLPKYYSEALFYWHPEIPNPDVDGCLITPRDIFNASHVQENNGGVA